MKIKLFTSLLVCAVVGLAQGPGPGGPGGRGPGRPGGPGGFGGFGGRGMGILGSPRLVTGAPYSGTEVLTIQQKFADGNSVNTTTSTGLARDGQGRTYVHQTITPPAAANKAPYTIITISDPVAGYRYELNSSTMIALQTRMPKAPSSTSTTTPTAPTLPSTTTRPNGATVTTVSLGTSSVNGVLASGTQTTEVIPAGAIGNAQAITITRTAWVATDLKVPVQIKSSDPRSGSSDMELTNIALGEPSATLFTVPSGYTIKTMGFGGGMGASGGHGRLGPGPDRGPGGRRPGGPAPGTSQNPA